MLVARMRKRLDQEDGFTLIELMVVVVNIGVLIAITMPTFIGAKNRAQNRGAEADARTAVVAARTAYGDTVSYSGATTTNMPALEASLTYVSGGTASAVGNQYSVSLATGAVNGNANQELGVAVMSPTGTCYTVDDVAAIGGSGAGGTFGTWYGTTTTAANCTGNWALANSALTVWT